MSSNITIATHNMGEDTFMNPTKWQADINKYAADTDLIFFEESWYLQQDWLGAGWGIVIKGGQSKGVAIAYRKSRITLLAHDFSILYDVGRTRGNVWVRLRVDGKHVIEAVSTHWPAGSVKGPHPDSLRQSSAKTAQLFNDQKHPMIIGADWNINVSHDPGNLSAKCPGGKWTKRDGIDGFFYSDSLVITNLRAIPIFSDHPVVLASVDVTNAAGDGGGGGKPTPKKERFALKVASCNVDMFHSRDSIKSDVEWVFAHFDADIICWQEARNVNDLLRNDVYGVATPDHPVHDGNKDQPISYRKSMFSLTGTRSWTLSDHAGSADYHRYLNQAHLVHKDTDIDFYVYDIHTYPHIDYSNSEKARIDSTKAYLEATGKHIQDSAQKANAITIWGGDFNFDFLGPDVNHYMPILSKYDMVPVSAELKLKKEGLGRTIDMLGSYKGDKKVSAKSFHKSPNVNSDHRFSIAAFSVLGFTSGGGGGSGSGSGEVGDPTVPSPDDPKLPTQPFQADLGHDVDIDHTDCCAGTETP